MNSISIVKHKNAKKVHKFGDILKPFEGWETNTQTANGWYSAPPAEVIEGDKPLFGLALVAGNPWKALKRLHIDAEDFERKIQYNCPWTTNKYWTFIPAWLCCSDTKFWTDRGGDIFKFGTDYVLDTEWQRKLFEDCKDENSIHVFGVNKSFLGHGYTEFTLPCDGDGYLKPATVMLSNGDYLLGHVWVWFNK